MKNAKKLAVAIASFGAASMCLIGGTFAWYVVSRTGTAVISGTTVSAESGLQVGIRLDTSSDNYETLAAKLKDDYDYTSDDPNNAGTDVYSENVLWAPDESGNTITAEVLRTVYESEHGNTKNGTRTVLKPVTTGAYEDGDSIEMKVNPETYVKELTSTDYKTPVYSDEEADEGDYIKFDLAFYTKGQEAEIYLDQSTTFDGSYGDGNVAARNQDVLKTLRVGFESDYYKKNTDTETTKLSSIYSPSKILPSDDDSSTNVGSRLDLDGDHLYDYTPIYTSNGDGTQSAKYYDKWYGQCVDGTNEKNITDLTSYFREMEYTKANPSYIDEDATPDVDPYIDGADHDAMDTVANAGKTGVNDNAWVAKSILGVTNTTTTSVATYTEDMTKMAAATQENHGLHYYDSVNGTATTKMLTATRSNDKYCAFVTVYIWFEGWDAAAGNIPNGGTFDATVRFVAPTIQASK